MTKIAKKLTDLVGNTPLLELGKFSTLKGLKTPVIAKVEYFNPGGSVKDRVALAMIEDAEAKGILKQHRRGLGFGVGGEGLQAHPHHARDHERGAAQPREGLRRNGEAHTRQGRHARSNKGCRGAARFYPRFCHPATV